MVRAHTRTGTRTVPYVPVLDLSIFLNYQLLFICELNRITGTVAITMSHP